MEKLGSQYGITAGRAAQAPEAGGTYAAGFPVESVRQSQALYASQGGIDVEPYPGRLLRPRASRDDRAPDAGTATHRKNVLNPNVK